MRWPWTRDDREPGVPDRPDAGAAHGVDVSAALGLLSRVAVVIDVRSHREFVRGHLPGARLVDARALRADPVEAIWGDDPLADTSKPVVVVSTTGARAEGAVALLRSAGHEAFSLTGGLGAWLKDGQVLVPGEPR